MPAGARQPGPKSITLGPFPTGSRSYHLPTPNYAFAKRQRDLAKKQRKEAKRQRKAGVDEAAAAATAEKPPTDEKSTP